MVAAGYKWPWRKGKGDLMPRFFVLGIGLALGAVVAAAAHDQISGPWPAFIFGVGAPATIRGILSGVEVEPTPQPKAVPASKKPRIRRSAIAEGSTREDAS
ncbi:hypothetical protein [Streptomyces sp. NPDC006552]|uniref:hypothetical protein n=1 Tax=Streptomyces sp. NPDC006552 TaxID=3157179 RepID=UPI0033BD39A4